MPISQVKFTIQPSQRISNGISRMAAEVQILIATDKPLAIFNCWFSADQIGTPHTWYNQGAPLWFVSGGNLTKLGVAIAEGGVVINDMATAQLVGAPNPGLYMTNSQGNFDLYVQDGLKRAGFCVAVYVPATDTLFISRFVAASDYSP